MVQPLETVPSSPAAQAMDQGQSLTAGALPQKSDILVVDDDPQVRSIVRLGLENSGFNVWVAANGTEAIDLFRAHGSSIAAVLMDICMPGLNGLATAEALRKLDPKVPFCFMSGTMADYPMNDLMKFGPVRYINKPFLLPEVITILQHLIRGLPSSA
jgi:CheY-like chemotaxis protein